MKNKNKFRYPWRTGNKFQILVDGHEYFSAMLAEINKSRKTILFEIYLIESGNIANKFIKALYAAKNRGVDIYLLLDDYGANNLTHSDKYKLTQPGINLFFYNPVNLYKISKSLKRNHRKLLIVDNEVAFIGGAGITDEFSPTESSAYWHDVMLRVEGSITSDLTDSFNKIWNEAHNYPHYTQPEIPIDKQNKFTSKNMARVLIGEGSDHNEINRAIVAHIRSSKEQVWLTSPYFITSWKIRRALRHAAKKGVDVRLLLPGSHSDHKWVSYAIHSYYPRLIKAKITIYEFQPRFTHSKIILCDDWFTIGSSNLDRWNQYLNLDANIEIYDQTSHEEVLKLFRLNFSHSKIISLDDWYARTFLQKLKEWISGVAVKILGFISRKFRR